ncbi:MAG: hypothetical protein U0610_17445 [bacterium]
MKLAWLLLPLAFQLPSQCQSVLPKKTTGPKPVLKCTAERQKCKSVTGQIGECVVGGADQCENPPCLICQY